MINLTKLRRLTGAQTRSQGDTFDFFFYAAINDIISDLITTTVLEVQAINEDTPPAEINLDEKYFQVFVTGVRHYMGRSKAYAKQDPAAVREEYQDALAGARGEAHTDNQTPTNWDF